MQPAPTLIRGVFLLSLLHVLNTCLREAESFVQSHTAGRADSAGLPRGWTWVAMSSCESLGKEPSPNLGSIRSPFWGARGKLRHVRGSGVSPPMQQLTGVAGCSLPCVREAVTSDSLKET